MPPQHSNTDVKENTIFTSTRLLVTTPYKSKAPGYFIQSVGTLYTHEVLIAE
jgi:hypothetical protein